MSHQPGKLPDIPRACPLVITVHGINSDGEWQERVAPILHPHCRCVPFKYPDYRYWGFALQFFSPAWGWLALACLGVALGLRWFPGLLQQVDTLAAWSGIPGATFWYYLLVPGLTALVPLLWVLRALLDEVRSPVVRDAAAWGKWLGVPLAGLLLVQVLFHNFGTQPVVWAGPFAAVAVLFFSLGDEQPGFPWALWWLVLLVAMGIFLGRGLGWEVAPTLVFGLVGAVVLGWMGRFTNLSVALLKTWLVPVAFCLCALWTGFFVSAGFHGFLQEATWAGLGLALVLGGVAGVDAFRRRRRLVERFRIWVKQQVETHRAKYKRPDLPTHLIAHSFGTYLTGQFLQSEGPLGIQGLNIWRVILVGSVLPCTFSWDRLLVDGCSLTHVRNETGQRDTVVLLAWCTEQTPLLRKYGFGGAGNKGFREAAPQGRIHDLVHPLEYCHLCGLREQRAQRRVHNIILPTFSHSDAYRDTHRCETFWLPFLLNYDPWEYWDFRRLCEQAFQYDRSIERLVNQVTELPDEADDKKKQLTKEVVRLQKELSVIEGQLRDRVWDWTQKTSGMSLGAWLEQLVGTVDPGPDGPELARSALGRLWRLVGQEAEKHRRILEKLRQERELVAEDLALLKSGSLAQLDPNVAIPLALEYSGVPT